MSILDLRFVRLSTVCGIILILQPSQAAPINFDFIIQDEPGSGFLDPTFGQQARDTLELAGNIWGGFLEQRFPGETITVKTRFSILPRQESRTLSERLGVRPLPE